LWIIIIIITMGIAIIVFDLIASAAAMVGLEGVRR
jgi:hypothetical protein